MFLAALHADAPVRLFLVLVLVGACAVSFVVIVLLVVQFIANVVLLVVVGGRGGGAVAAVALGCCRS